MEKSELLVVVTRKWQDEFSKNTSIEAYINRTFDRFCAISTVEDREHPHRLSKIKEQKIDEICDVIQDEPQSSVRAVVTTCSIPPTTAYRIMS